MRYTVRSRSGGGEPPHFSLLLPPPPPSRTLVLRGSVIRRRRGETLTSTFSSCGVKPSSSLPGAHGASVVGGEEETSREKAMQGEPADTAPSSAVAPFRTLRLALAESLLVRSGRLHGLSGGLRGRVSLGTGGKLHVGDSSFDTPVIPSLIAWPCRPMARYAILQYTPASVCNWFAVAPSLIVHIPLNASRRRLGSWRGH